MAQGSAQSEWPSRCVPPSSHLWVRPPPYLHPYDTSPLLFQPTNHTLGQFAENALHGTAALAQEIVPG